MPLKAGAGLSKDVVGPVGVGVDLAPPSLPLGVESVLGSPLADRDPLAGASVALRPCGLGSARGRRGLRPCRVPGHLGSTLSLLFLNLGLGLLGGPGLLLLLGLFGAVSAISWAKGLSFLIKPFLLSQASMSEAQRQSGMIWSNGLAMAEIAQIQLEFRDRLLPLEALENFREKNKKNAKAMPPQASPR